MRREVMGVRIWPMSDKAPGFVGRAIEDVQRRIFLRDLPAKGGRFRYPKMGLNARAGAVVLFQYQACVIASAVFVRDEKFDRPRDGYAGALHLEVESIQVFEPIDADAMRAAWPAFRAFGHVKQFLNPGGYARFARGLKRVEVAKAREGAKTGPLNRPRH